MPAFYWGRIGAAVQRAARPPPGVHGGLAHNAAQPRGDTAMRKPPRSAPVLLLSLALAAGLPAGCASTGAPVDVTGAEVATRDLGNGDTLEEYRVGGQLRMVKITPARGAPYYLYDRDGDGALDRDQADDIPQTYWKLFSW
jgi:hypothetical protein